MTEIAGMISDSPTSRFWLLVVGQMIAVALAAFGGTYFAQKGKNRADREDIKKLTETVEDVKRISLVQSKTHETVREKQIEALRAVYCELSRLGEFTRLRAKLFRFAGEDEALNMKAFWEQYRKTAEEILHHSLLIRDDLNGKIENLMLEVQKAGMGMDMTNALPVGSDKGRMLQDDFDFAFKTLPELLKEIRAASKDVLKSGEVEL